MAGCGHGDPFASSPSRTNEPLVAGDPARLTWDGGWDAAWVPDGHAIVFSGLRGLFQRPDTTRDVCLGVMPATGGQSLQSICPLGTTQLDSVDALEMPGISSGGRLAFLHSALRPPQLSWARRELVLSSLQNPYRRHILATLPQFGIASHNALSQLRWLDEQRFVYRADQVRYNQAPPQVTPLFIMLVDVTGDPATFTVVPGTSGATGVAVEQPDAILYSLMNDSRVYRRLLSTGDTATVRDFGSVATLEDVQREGAQLVVLLNGEHVVTGIDAASPVVRLIGSGYRGLALAPDGHAVVAESSRTLVRFTLP